MSTQEQYNIQFINHGMWGDPEIDVNGFRFNAMLCDDIRDEREVIASAQDEFTDFLDDLPALYERNARHSRNFYKDFADPDIITLPIPDPRDEKVWVTYDFYKHTLSVQIGAHATTLYQEAIDESLDADASETLLRNGIADALERARTRVSLADLKRGV